jgi:hypothetical protein
MLELRCCWFELPKQKWEEYLHKTAKTDDGVIQTRVGNVLLSAAFDFHKWHLGMLLTVVDRKENKALNAHGLSALYQGHFAIPVYLQCHQILAEKRHSFFSSVTTS